jgi:hypothetical protein
MWKSIILQKQIKNALLELLFRKFLKIPFFEEFPENFCKELFLIETLSIYRCILVVNAINIFFLITD